MKRSLVFTWVGSVRSLRLLLIGYRTNNERLIDMAYKQRGIRL